LISVQQQDWLGIAGRRALVAGAGGLGGASAVALAAQGATVTVIDVDRERLDALQAMAPGSDGTGPGGSINGIVADLHTADGCRSAVDEALETARVPDIFVHAVGRNNRKPVLEFSDDEWSEIIDLNLSSAFWLGQAVGRAMVERGSGRLVFVSSVSGWLAHADHAPYAATKGGINQLVRVMAREWAPHGITVNAVAPGYVETDLTRGYLDTDGHRTALESLVPAGRLGVPQEVADAVTFLASDRASFVTGHVLWVDGGRSLV
jgi:gluconate 5-dehydrogenase